MRAGLGSPNSEQNGGESLLVRWTCTYQGLAGASGRADFDCVDQATRFADLHANRTGAPTGEWERHGNAWVLSTQLGRYIVRPTNAPME